MEIIAIYLYELVWHQHLTWQQNKLIYWRFDLILQWQISQMTFQNSLLFLQLVNTYLLTNDYSFNRDGSEHMLARCSPFWWCSGFGVRAHARTHSCLGLMLGEYSVSIKGSRIWKLQYQKCKKIYFPLYVNSLKKFQ